MTDENIRELLQTYVESEMALIVPAKLDGYNHEFTKKYKKRIRKLFWSEKYFGKKISIGYTVRKAAAVFAVVAGLVLAGEVSAKVFGFRPWKYISRFISEYQMEERIYENQKKTSDTQNLKIAQHDYPTYMIEGLKKSTVDENNFNIFCDYLSPDKTGGIQYQRNDIVDGMVSMTDGEYTNKQRCEVAGYEAYIYEKLDQEDGMDEMWILWDDTKYSYFINMVNIRLDKNELLKIANSIYEKK